MRCDSLWLNARLLTMASAAPTAPCPGVIAVTDGRIVYAGSAADAPALDAAVTQDCEGRWITPGLVDCHTHLVYAGNRAREFEMRLAGAVYAEIAQAGGGILSTMRATRAATLEDLVAQSLTRLDALIATGATTVEIKSGYGLDTASEAKMLRAARELATRRRVTITTSFLGAHALPPEFAQQPDAYIAHLCDDMLPTLASQDLVDAVDGFCETIAFTPAQIDRLFATARRLGLPVKLHAEQLSNQHGAALAAQHRALSADHLEHLDAAGIAAMAAANTVATLLPGAFYFCRETQRPPVAALRAAGVPIAIATDCNPGTSPLTSLLLAMNMAATLFGLTVDECLAGVTINAARALGMTNHIGTIEAGKSADFVIWDIEHPSQLVYAIGANPLHARVWRGQ